MRKLICVATILFVTGFSSFFADAHAATKKDTKSSTTVASNKKVLSSAWHIMRSSNGKAVGYYSERFEEPSAGRIAAFQTLVQLEGDHQLKEHLGSFAKSNPELSPEFFNMERSVRMTKLTIDGTFDEKGSLSARVRENEKELPILKRSMPKNAFLSALFPIWLSLRKDEFSKKSVSFNAILENRYDMQFSPVAGSVTLASEDSFSKNEKLKRLRVILGDDVSYWYLDDQIAPRRIVFEANGLVVERSTEEEAKSSLLGDRNTPLAKPSPSK